MSEIKKQNNENIKNSETNSDDKIPNSLIIYIKTRIPNFYRFNYEPYMSVPKNKSHTVYFDPLIKYYEAPIKNLPSGAPKDALVTQFVEAAEFDSMINRILSDFRYMQKKRTFKQAYDEHIIENNLHITLKNLFKQNNLFYLNKKPYTIVGVKSNLSDWQIDKKPLEKLLGQFPNKTAQQLEDEAINEEDDIPEILRQGTVSSSTITESENISVVASGLKQASETQDNTVIETEISEITDSFITQDELPGVSGDLLDLYTKYLRQNIPINYSNNVDYARDPLTLSLLIEPTDLLNFINTHKKSALIELYSTYTNSKINLQQADKSYIDLCIEFAKYKTKFDYEIKTIREFIRKQLNKLPIDEQKQRTQYLMLQITQLKTGYIQLIFYIADAINQIYQLQHVYFVSTNALLQGLKEDYVNIIQYYEKPELALKCIDNDIDTINLLIKEDTENPYSLSYFLNYKKFKQFYENQLYKNRQELLEPQVNFSDESKLYINERDILLIEKYQYDIYNFKMFLSYTYNQFDIWVVLFKSIELFVKFIGEITTDIILLADSSMKELNKRYTLEEQNTLIKSIGSEGIRATYDKKTNELKWFLVKQDGTKAINTETQNLVDESFQDLYINYIKTSVKAYDAIILYIYLLEILCLRQNRVYVAEENVNQLNLESSLSLEQYYDSIIRNINKVQNKTNVYIPSSILWDVTDFNNIDVVEKRKKINTKSNVIYRARLKSITESRNNLVSSCDEISKLITPNISKTGFIEQCNSIVSKQISNIQQHKFRSSYWVGNTIKSYDIQATNDFIYNMNKAIKDAWYDRIIDDINVKDYLDWMVFDNESGIDDIDSLYAAVSDGLNRQLELTENETTNPYTETIDGRQMFTTKTIKQLFIDNKTESDIDTDNDINSIRILERILKIKFIIFEMFPHNLPISIGDMVLYKGRPHRILNITETDDGKILYNLYNGYAEIKDVLQTKVKNNPNNPLQKFRIFCDYANNNQDIQFNDYMYIALTKYNNEDYEEDLKKFKLVHNTNTTYIFTQDQIPIYIKYLIFNSCSNLDEDQFIKIGFGNDELLHHILEFKTKRKENIERENISKDITDIDKKIAKYKSQIEILRSIKDKSLEEHAEKLLYKEEIKDLKQRKIMLQEFLNELRSKSKPIPTRESNTLGGATTLKPSEQYPSLEPQYNPMGYPLNPNMPGNVIYLPHQGYPYQNLYSNRYNVPYNVSQNKAKDQKSKLSFYITIELELFPGTSANMLQQSIVKCQSTFERIREAWADIFGFEYRPAPMNEVYSYNLQDMKKKDYNRNITEKNRKSEKNKTRKNNLLK